jgi:hypothetical protein
VDWARSDGALTIEFEAEDPTKRVAWETELALAEQARIARDEPRKPMGKAKQTALGCVVTPLVLFGACLMHTSRPELQWTGGIIVILLVVSYTLGTQGLQRRAVKPRPVTQRPLTSRFTLCITPATLTLSADGLVVREIAIADIADVIGGERVEIVRQDGLHAALPMTRLPFVNEELAADIRAGIREVRALGADYRGAKLTP